MTYTFDEILGDERCFRQFNEGYDKLLETMTFLGHPKGYERGIDYGYEILSSCCHSMSREEIITLCEAIDHVQSKRMRYYLDNKIPYPADYDAYKENYKDVVEYLSKGKGEVAFNRFVDAYNEVDLSKLTNDQLTEYGNMGNNMMLEADEMLSNRQRGATPL